MGIRNQRSHTGRLETKRQRGRKKTKIKKRKIKDKRERSNAKRMSGMMNGIRRLSKKETK